MFFNKVVKKWMYLKNSHNLSLRQLNNSNQLFRFIQRHHTYNIIYNNKKDCNIKVFCMIIDNNDILIFKDPDDTVQIGFTAPVYRTGKKIEFKKINFDKVCKESIEDAFFDLFKDIKGKILIQKTNQIFNLSILKEHIYIQSCLNAIKVGENYDSIAIIYFIVLPDIMSVKLEVESEAFKIESISIADFLNSDISMHYISNKVKELIRSKQIMIPKVETKEIRLIDDKEKESVD